MLWWENKIFKQSIKVGISDTDTPGLRHPDALQPKKQSETHPAGTVDGRSEKLMSTVAANPPRCIITTPFLGSAINCCLNYRDKQRII